jgi:hypothetical protein
MYYFNSASTCMAAPSAGNYYRILGKMRLAAEVICSEVKSVKFCLSRKAPGNDLGQV